MTATDAAIVTTGPIETVTPGQQDQDASRTGRSRILVVDRTPDIADALRAALGDHRRCEIVHLARPGQLLEVIQAEGPWEAVVAGPTQAGPTALRRLADLRGARPDLGLLVTLNGSDPGDLKMLVHAQPDELVRLPTAKATLRNALVETLAKGRERRRRAEAAALAPPQPHATIYAVVGPTGGSGKTMLALNLAYLMAQREAGTVIIADLDLQFGEVAPALQIKARQTIHEVLFDDQERPVDEVVAAEALAESLFPTTQGFSVLAAPSDPAEGDRVSPEQLAMLINLLRCRADVLVLDTPTGLGESTLAAVDAADHIVAVTQVDVPGVANLQAFLATLDQLGADEERRTVVLNKEMPNTGLTSGDIEKVLGTLGGSIPFDPAVTRALNRGLPVCAAEPGHPASKAILWTLAPLLPALPARHRGRLPKPAPARPRRRRWRR